MSESEEKETEGSRFSKENMQRIEAVEIRQKSLRDNANLRRRLNSYQLSAFNVNDEEAVNHFCEIAFNTKSQFDSDQQHGMAKVVKETTGIAAVAYGLLRNFSPMVEVVKDLGAPCGNAAIGTLCCLFAVAQSRVSIEENIEATLGAIKDRLPGLSMYRHIYNENHELDQLVQSQIVETYTSFMEYCIEALEFYTRGSCYRFLQAFMNHDILSKKAEQVQQAVVRVRLTCEDTLNKNVNTIKKKLEEVQVSNEGLHAQIQELQRHNDLTTMRQMSALLNIHDFSYEKHCSQLNDYKRDIDAEFWSKTWQGKQERIEQVNQIRTNETFKTWCESKDSGVFIILGENEYDRAHNCWASYAALDLLDDELAKGSTDLSSICAFHIFGHREHENTHLHVLSSLIYQILRANREILQDQKQLEELLAKLYEYQNLLKESSERCNAALEDVVLRAMSNISKEKAVWIVLDRVERCCHHVERQSPSGGRSRKGALALLKCLNRAAQHGTANIKVLAVVNRVDWRIDHPDDIIWDVPNINVERFCQVI